MITDPISDMLIRIKNALAIQKLEVFVPLSKAKLSLAKILKKQGLFEKVIRKTDQKIFKIKLKNNKIQDLKRVSKPGCRVYIKSQDIRLKNTGFSVISTSQGLMLDAQARNKNLGGEILCHVSAKNQ